MGSNWSILGLSSGSSEAEIKKAYRKLSMRHHPDRGGDAAKFAEVSKAYKSLLEGDVGFELKRGYGGAGSTGVKFVHKTLHTFGYVKRS